jgi:hypothetical protein
MQKSRLDTCKSAREKYTPQVGHHIRRCVKTVSFSGLFFSIFGTCVIMAGSDSFHCSSLIWKSSLGFNLLVFCFTWLIYIPFKGTDRLIGIGILTLLMYFSLFWMFVFSTFYFYFLFAPVNIFLRVAVLAGSTAAFMYRAHLIIGDIKQAFQKHNKLFNRMYCDEGAVFTFNAQATRLLEKSRKNRDAFKLSHLYVGLIALPFIIILNRIFNPASSDDHSIFLFLSFLAFPMSLWGVEACVQTIMITIYYPFELQRRTGKIVLIKDWY